MENNYAAEQASAQLTSIVEKVKRLTHINECTATFGNPTCHEKGNVYVKAGATEEEKIIAYHNEDDAREAIQEDPIDIRVRSDWHTPSDTNSTAPDEYEILLCTGGPAVRITGALGEHAEPENATLEYQDWGTPWTEYYEANNDELKDLLTYARQFYFGE